MICILSSEVLIEARASGAVVAAILWRSRATNPDFFQGRPLSKVRVVNLTTNLVFGPRSKQTKLVHK